MSDTQDATPNAAQLARDAWVGRVLGIDLAGRIGGKTAATASAGFDLASWAEACDGLEAAVDTVSHQIDDLRRALAEVDDEEDLIALGKRADFGLNGFTDNKRVPLMAAMLEAGRSDPAKIRMALPKVVSTAQALREHVETDERIDACDDNPFDLKVTIRATLGAALAEVQAVGTRLLAA